jgi:hypothetical protein
MSLRLNNVWLALGGISRRSVLPEKQVIPPRWCPGMPWRDNLPSGFTTKNTCPGLSQVHAHAQPAGCLRTTTALHKCLHTS